MSTRILALALTYLGGVDAFFRINCATINRGRIDPLVNPGTLAAHSHTIVGSASELERCFLGQGTILTHSQTLA